MSQGKGKAFSNKRHSSGDHPYDDRSRLESSFDPPHSAPSSFLDASIPLNLPPRRSMKMLKDGSDFVWPESAHSLFVKGLQAWKFQNIGSKRTRAPRGEGKTDFLVRFLESNGVERTKKQVASHLQVLRTEWRNTDNTVLLSLVDDTVPHTRSLSEPTLPPLSPSNSSLSSSLSLFNPLRDHVDHRAISTPSLPSSISTLLPPPSSSLYHAAHDVYNSPPHTYQEGVSSPTFRTQPGVNIASWQPDDAVWNTPAPPEPESRVPPTIHHPIPSYDPPPTFHDYEHTPRPPPPSGLPSRGFSSEYYVVRGRTGTPSSSVAAPLAPIPQHPLATVPLDTGSPPYGVYASPPSYAAPQTALQPHDAYSPAYRPAPYHSHYSSGAEVQRGGGIATGSASSYGDAVEPALLAEEQIQEQPHAHPSWPPATTSFSRPPSASQRHSGSPRR